MWSLVYFFEMLPGGSLQDFAMQPHGISVHALNCPWLSYSIRLSQWLLPLHLYSLLRRLHSTHAIALPLIYLPVLWTNEAESFKLINHPSRESYKIAGSTIH